MVVGLIFGCSVLCAAMAVAGPWLVRRHSSGRLIAASAMLPILVIATASAAFLGYRVGVFYSQHWSGPFPGSIRSRALNELTQYHTILLIACVASILGILRHRWYAPRTGKLLAGAFGMVAAVLAAIAVLATLPRSGDEGVVLWILLAPAMGLAMLILFILSAGLIAGGVRHWGEPEDVAGGPPTCPDCGYQLTGNVSGTCPECGRAVPATLQPTLGKPIHLQPSGVILHRDRTAALAFAAGCAGILFSILASTPPMAGLIPLPGLSTFLIWRVEPWWLGLGMGAAIIAAARGLSVRRNWAVAIIAAWALANVCLGAVNVSRAMPFWYRMPPGLFTAGRFIPWLVLHVAWSVVLPAWLLLSLRRAAK